MWLHSRLETDISAAGAPGLGAGESARPAGRRHHEARTPPPFHGAAAEDARRAPRHLAGFNHARSSVRIG